MNDETTGILAAVAAPLFMTLGFIIWDVTWKTSGGSAFALNLFKCNLAALGFLIITFILGWNTATATNNGNNLQNSNDQFDGQDMIVAVVFSTRTSVSFLILSGFIGIIIGDLAWLEALRLLGATKVLVIDSIKPFTAALLGWIFLDESVHTIAYSGIVLTIIGVLVVSLERGRKEEEKEEKENCETNDNQSVLVLNIDADDSNSNHMDSSDDIHENERSDIIIAEEDINDRSIMNDNDNNNDIDNNLYSKCRLLWNFRGYVFAIGNVFLDTYGSLLTKKYGVGMSTWAINLVRFGSAGIFMAIISIVSNLIMTLKKRNKLSTDPEIGSDNENNNASNNNNNNNSSSSSSSNQRPWYLLPKMNLMSWIKICIGVLFVTFLCPALSNYALFQISLALALTLGSIAPLYALILEWPLQGKRPTIRATIGAFLAVGGVGILSVWQK
jgi:drug/metabolite transporter (DMT)-like permease